MDTSREALLIGPDPLPARVAVRATFGLSFALTLLVTLTVDGPALSFAFYWALTLGYAYLSFSRRVGERFLSAYVSLAWLLAGLGTALWFGMAGAGTILVASIALIGLFYGVRVALVTVGVCTAYLGCAGALAAHGMLPGVRTGLDPDRFAALWGSSVATFASVATMTALVQAAVLERARRASARARSFALAAELTNDAVAICHADRRLEWVNEGFTRLTG